MIQVIYYINPQDFLRKTVFQANSKNLFNSSEAFGKRN